MNTHDKIELPPLPPGYPTYEFPEGAYDSEQMQDYARAAIEADRKRRSEPVVESIEKLAINRYRPVPAGLLAYKVVAGDGSRSLFSGTKDECKIVAAKLIEAFLDGAHVASQPHATVRKTDWDNELSSWSDDDFIRIFHECPDLVNRLRKILAEQTITQ